MQEKEGKVAKDIVVRCVKTIESEIKKIRSQLNVLTNMKTEVETLTEKLVPGRMLESGHEEIYRRFIQET